MDCNSINNMLSAFLDEELGPEERRIVRQHLFGCTQCQNSLRELKQLHRMLGSMESVVPPVDFADELRREVMQPTVRLIPGSRWVPVGIWTLAAAAAVSSLFFIGSLMQIRPGLPQNLAEEVPPAQTVVEAPASEPGFFLGSPDSSTPSTSLASESVEPRLPSSGSPVSAVPAATWSVTPAGQTLFGTHGFESPTLFPLGR